MKISQNLFMSSNINYTTVESTEIISESNTIKNIFCR
jgi:hypothetical protein